MFSNGEVKGEYIIYVIKRSYQVSSDHRSCECNCVHNFDDRSLFDFKSAVQYMKHFIYHFKRIIVIRKSFFILKTCLFIEKYIYLLLFSRKRHE